MKRVMHVKMGEEIWQATEGFDECFEIMGDDNSPEETIAKRNYKITILIEVEK